MAGAAQPVQSDSVNAKKLARRLRRQTGQAVADYGMLADGDRVLVCLSGGKDSYTMLDMLLHLQARAPVQFEITALNLDQKQPDFPGHVLPEYLSGLGLDYTILERDTYSVVTEKVPEGATLCGLCARLRRGILYSHAREHGFTKIALGHHRDDIVETLFLNMFFGGTLKAMPPKLVSDDGENVVIRPLAYCSEADIAKWAEVKDYPIIPCNLCGSQDGLQRQLVKKMLADWEKVSPGRTANIFKAITNVAPSQLADTSLFDFVGVDGAPVFES